MIFFTRQLHLGIQPGSGWERRAQREWGRRASVYAEYAKVIACLLPSAVRRLCRQGLHDGVVCKASLRRGVLVLVVDARNALGGFRGRQVQLTFRGVRGQPAIAKLVGQWWLYEEVHLTSRARFNLQVLFDRSELSVDADQLVIEIMPRSRVTFTAKQ